MAGWAVAVLAGPARVMAVVVRSARVVAMLAGPARMVVRPARVVAVPLAVLAGGALVRPALPAASLAAAVVVVGPARRVVVGLARAAAMPRLWPAGRAGCGGSPRSRRPGPPPGAGPAAARPPRRRPWSGCSLRHLGIPEGVSCVVRRHRDVLLVGDLVPESEVRGGVAEQLDTTGSVERAPHRRLVADRGDHERR